MTAILWVLLAGGLLALGWTGGVLTTKWRLRESEAAKEWVSLCQSLREDLRDLRPTLEKHSKTFEKMDTTVGNMTNAFVKARIIRQDSVGRMVGEEETHIPRVPHSRIGG